jgi:hypothetical protein
MKVPSRLNTGWWERNDDPSEIGAEEREVSPVAWKLQVASQWSQGRQRLGMAHNVGWLELLPSTTNAAFGGAVVQLGSGAA